MYSFVVHSLSVSSQQHMQPPIPEARLLPRQLHQPRALRLIPSPRLVAITRYRHRHHPTRPPLAEGILLLHLLDSRLQGYELHPFFRITDCSASLSRLRSATSFRSRVFSSRNCFASCAWLTSIPRTSPSTRRSCALTRPLPAPHPRRLALRRPVSRPRLSPPRCACSETCLFPFLSTKS